MSDQYLKIIAAFYQAKRVDHYYWLHTDLENDPTDSISIENVQWIVATLKGVKIEKEFLEPEVKSRFHRAFIEHSLSDGTKAKVIRFGF